MMLYTMKQNVELRFRTPEDETAAVQNPGQSRNWELEGHQSCQEESGFSSAGRAGAGL